AFLGSPRARVELALSQKEKPVLKLVRLERIDVKRDHLGELGGLIRRDIAGCRGGYDGGGGSDRSIGGLGKGRQLAKQIRFFARARVDPGTVEAPRYCRRWPLRRAC